MVIFDQLKEYCDCVDVEESDVNELVNLISAYTCWMEKPCDTFLMGERREVVDLPNCTCECDVFTFEPFFTPFDPDSFTFTLIEQDGITETAIPVTEINYSIVDSNFRLALPLPDCKCKPHCGCEPKYKLLVEYMAGYEELPDCLLPIFCEALQWIKEKNTCDCSECEPCNTSTSTTILDREIPYATLTGRLQDYFLQILTVQYRKQLSLISLCTNAKKLWGVVV